MSCIINFSSRNNRIIGEEIGSVLISMYKDKSTKLPFFHVQAENEKVLSLSNAIEIVLKNFKSE